MERRGHPAPVSTNVEWDLSRWTLDAVGQNVFEGVQLDVPRDSPRGMLGWEFEILSHNAFSHHAHRPSSPGLNLTPSVRSLQGNSTLAPGSHRRWIPGVTAPTRNQS